MNQERWLLSAKDLRNSASLILSLRDTRNPLSRHLCAQFSAKTRRLLEGFDGTCSPPTETLDALVKALNAVLQGPSLYQPSRFRHVALTKGTAELIRQKPGGADCTRLNRLLLAEAYGREVSTGMQTGKKDWHKFQIEKFETELPHYEAYTETLRKILETICKSAAPLAIVQARPKSRPSFAEKVLRKAFKYDYPVYQITDLCGARVITETLDEAERVCDIIRSHFIIDEANSLDQRTLLRVSEFGYLSVHYVVQVGGKEILGVPIPKTIGDRKAEIQVRTLLQHAWGSIRHDRVYKTQVKVPEHWNRDLARLAAMLEEADRSFLRVVQGLDAYQLNYGAYMSPAQIKHELETLQTLLENETVTENRQTIALRIAQVAKATWDWETIVKQLDPFVKDKERARPELLLEHGHALCQVHRKAPSGVKFNTGQKELQQAANRGEGKTRVQSLSYLAWSYGNQPGRESEAREKYGEAFRMDPSNPYILAAYLEYEIYCGKDRAFVRHMRHCLLDAIETCREHATVGIELPWAFFAMGKFHLLLQEPYESLAAYAKAIHLCNSETAATPEGVLDSEREFLRRINFGRLFPPEDRWVDDLLLLAKTAQGHDARATSELKGRALRKKPFKQPVVLVAGGTHPDIEQEMQQYRDCLFRVFENFEGTIISGGTTAGIPGLVGELAQHLRSGGCERFETIGYLPTHPPSDAPEDSRYNEVLKTKGEGFTPGEPLQSWIDLLAEGVRPSEVRVLGINGGQIAALEYRLALSLGATVGVIESSGRAVAELLPDADWWDAANLLWLPRDPMTVRAFVNPGQPTLDPTQLDKAGESVHNAFLEENRHKSKDPAMQPWMDLRPDLKKDNENQAAYAAEILRRLGYGVRQATGNDPVLSFESAEIETMAEMEHGRWIVERLGNGWKYGPQRDPDNKISPYLVSWKDLPEEAKNYDRTAVSKWPEVLAQAGLEINRLPARSDTPLKRSTTSRRANKKQR